MNMVRALQPIRGGVGMRDMPEESIYNIEAGPRNNNNHNDQLL